MPELRSRTIDDFLRELASASATPGGGSVAALSGAIASDLGSMVCRLTLKRAPTDQLADLLARFVSLEGEFLELAEADESAFSAVMDAYGIDRSDESRAARIASALFEATRVPQQVAELGIDLLQDLCTLAPLGSKQSVSDAGVAAHLATAAVRSALLNVRINLAYMRDRAMVEEMEKAACALDDQCTSLSERAVSAVAQRIS